jgi:hypothetical protein
MLWVKETEPAVPCSTTESAKMTPLQSVMCSQTAEGIAAHQAGIIGLRQVDAALTSFMQGASHR